MMTPPSSFSQAANTTDAPDPEFVASKKSAAVPIGTSQIELVVQRKRGFWHILPVFVAITAQLLALLWLIWQRTPDVPWWDEWETTKLVHKWNQGTVSLNDFWAFHNEHRIVIPRLIDLIVIEWTQWNRQIEMSIDLAIAVGSLALFLITLRATVRSPRLMILLAIPVVWLVLSMGQWEDFLWAFQISFIATVFGVALCTWAVGTRPATPRSFVYLLFGALVASLSNLTGLCAWIAFFPALWLAGYRKRRYFLLWIVSAAAIIVPYARGFPSEDRAIPSIFDGIAFALAYLGAPVTSFGHLFGSAIVRTEVVAAVSIGLTLVNVVVFWLLERTLRPLRAWIGLGLFALGSAGIIAAGRGPAFGLTFALTSRYQAFAALWWVAVIPIAVMTVVQVAQDLSQRHAKRRWSAGLSAMTGINALMPVVVGLSLIIVNFAGFQDGWHWMDSQRLHQDCILNYDSATNDCLKLFYLPENIRADAPYLEEDHLSIFHDHTALHFASLVASASLTQSNIEDIGPVSLPQRTVVPITVLQGSPLTVSGWAIDDTVHDVAGGVFISIDGTYHVLADYGFDRPDVASYLKYPAVAKSGFIATLDTDHLSPGMHTLTMQVISHDRRSYSTSSQQAMIDIRAPIAPTVPSASLEDQYGIARIPGETRVGFGIRNGSYATREDSAPILMAHGASLVIDGWAVDVGADEPAAAVFLSVDHVHDMRVDYGVARPDVMQALGNDPAYLRSGFSVVVPTDEWVQGPHRITLKIVTFDARGYYESVEHLLVEVQ